MKQIKIFLLFLLAGLSATAQTWSGDKLTLKDNLKLRGSVVQVITSDTSLALNNDSTIATVKALRSYMANHGTTGGGTGSVNTVGIAPANGFTGTSSGGANPVITIVAGNITPGNVTASGTVTGSNISGTHTGSSSGSNSGDQTIFGRSGNITAAANDYTWGQINKSTSSIADITTRSAGDLNTGTLLDSRLSTNVPLLSNPINSFANAISYASNIHSTVTGEKLVPFSMLDSLVSKRVADSLANLGVAHKPIINFEPSSPLKSSTNYDTIKVVTDSGSWVSDVRLNAGNVEQKVKGAYTIKFALPTGGTYTSNNGITLTGSNFTNDFFTGKAGSQSLFGGTAASENLTLSSTANATKGKITAGVLTVDEANGRIGISNANPASGFVLDVNGAVRVLSKHYISIGGNSFGSAGAPLQVGGGPFDGVSAGFLNGNSNGQSVAINESSGYLGDFEHFALAGVNKWKITKDGIVSNGIWNAGIIPVTYGGTGTATPGLIQGTNVTITGTWPNQTINASGSAGANAAGTYIVQTATNAPANAQILGSLTTGIVKNTSSTGVLSIAAPGTDYLAPTGSAASLTGFPTFNQNTTGTAAGLSSILSPTWGGTGVNNGSNTMTWAANTAFAGLFGVTITSTAATNATLPAGTNTLYGTGTGSITSAQLTGSLSDETGTGVIVAATSPTLVTPNIGVATSTSLNKVTITAPTTSATLTLVQGSSLITAGAFALTLTSSAASNLTIPAGTNTAYSTLASSITSAQLTGSLSDETGTGAIVAAVSPALTGTPTAPTASAFTNTTQIATTAFVEGEVLAGRTPFVQTADVTVVNTTTSTSLIGTGTGSATLPANYFTVGRIMVLHGIGSISNLAANSPTLNFFIGATGTPSNWAGPLATAFTNAQVEFEVDAVCRSTGATGNIQVNGWCKVANSTTGAEFRMPFTGGNFVVNTTTTNLIDLKAGWSAASTSNSLLINRVQIETKN